MTTMDDSELKRIIESVIEDLIDRYHLSGVEATCAVEVSEVDKLIVKYPYHVRHYPIEMISAKVYSLVFGDSKRDRETLDDLFIGYTGSYTYQDDTGDSVGNEEL